MAGLDPGSPDRAGTGQGSLEDRESPGMGGPGSPDDSCQARTAARSGDPGPTAGPSPSLPLALPYLASRRNP